MRSLNSDIAGCAAVGTVAAIRGLKVNQAEQERWVCVSEAADIALPNWKLGMSGWHPTTRSEDIDPAIPATRYGRKLPSEPGKANFRFRSKAGVGFRPIGNDPIALSASRRRTEHPERSGSAGRIDFAGKRKGRPGDRVDDDQEREGTGSSAASQLPLIGIMVATGMAARAGDHRVDLVALMHAAKGK